MKRLSISAAMCLLSLFGFTQPAMKDGKFFLTEDGSRYLKLTFLNQAWFRYSQYNPGTTVFGYAKDDGADIGIRRFRIQAFGSFANRTFFYCQIGENNFNSLSDRKAGFFVHDALGEFAVIPGKFSLGMGLTAWSGLSRFSSPSVGTIMGVDAPLFLQSTNDVTDQFLRKLSVYGKGKFGPFDYRVVVSQPMAIQKAGANYHDVITTRSDFSHYPAKLQYNGYFQYQFKDEENNDIPYMTGTYLGKKNVLNVGAGFVFQPDAMWRLNESGDTVTSHLFLVSTDVFWDKPVGTEGEAISFYASLSWNDFGKNYYRNLGVMNPATGTTTPNILNGAGNAWPAYGTGTQLYAQFGYKLKDNLFGQTTCMPYASFQMARYQALKDLCVFYDAGVSYLLRGHQSKLGIAYQNRPVFLTNGTTLNRRSALVIQYQVSL